MALARIRSLEQLRYQAPGEWGKLLGLDRIPEVRTLREKVELLCKDPGRAKEWNGQLAKEWMARSDSADVYYYCDGHVRSITERKRRCRVITWRGNGCVCE